MKAAHVATRWIGEGTPDDKYRADMPEPHGPMPVIVYQYVNLALDCPSPNVVVVRVEENREKHKGYIDSLKTNLNQILLEAWEDDGPMVPVASDLKFRNFLTRQGMDDDKAHYIVDAPDRVNALLGELDLADKRARRRIEIEGRA